MGVRHFASSLCEAFCATVMVDLEVKPVHPFMTSMAVDSLCCPQSIYNNFNHTRICSFQSLGRIVSLGRNM